MSKLKVEDILWSRNPSPLRQAVKKISFPAMFKVAQGYDSPDENESLARDQVIRIHQVHTQTRVLANVKKNIFLSLPLRYSDARFETSNSKASKKDKKDKTPSEKSKPMYIRDVIDKSQLPRDVHFYTGDDLTFQLQLKNSTVSEKFSTITLKNMYEVTYLQGNSIFHNHLDTMVVNIPLYAPIDVYIAEGFKTSTPEKWNKYQSLLGKLVGKHVTFELYPGNQNITYFNDKRLDKAKTQADYEMVVPSGNLVITAGNARLKHHQRKTGGAGASKTVGASAGANGANGQIPTSRKAAPAPSSNSNNSTFQGGTANDRRHSLLDEMEAEEERRISNAGATVPRSILRNEARKHAAAEAAAVTATPTRAESVTSEEDNVPLGEDAASLHKRLMLRRQSTSDVPLNSAHAGIPHTPEQAKRKISTPMAPLQMQSQWQRDQIDSPRSMGSNPSFEYSASAGSPSPMHTSASTPSFNSSSGAADARSNRRISAPPKMHRQASSVASGSSDNAFHSSSGLNPPVDIPAPDYDGAPPLPSKGQRPPMTSWQSTEKAEPPNRPSSDMPPSPPPLSTMPSRQGQASMPSRSVPSPPSSNAPPPPGAGPPAPPPPPGVPPPPGPLPPGAPPPPGPPPPVVGPPAPPPPPPPGGVGGGDSAPAAGGLAASIANAKLKPASERAERPPPPPKEDASPMGNMMKELKAVQERRKSMGDALISDNVEKMSTGSSGSGSEQTELQKAMERRKLGNFNAGPRAPPNPLPKANTPKPKWNANNSPRNNSPRNNVIVNNNNTTGTIHNMRDVPKDLRGLTVNQVSQVLKLLNLGKYEARFKENFIDGEMMGTLTAEMLKNDLGCTSQLDVNKIMKFIQGWRPA